MIEPELLVSNVDAAGHVLYRNKAWINLLGDQEDLWDRLVPGDEDVARQNFGEAVGGSLVTHALFMVSRSDLDQPVPVLLHFIPISKPEESDATKSNLVTITGEILAEPTSWTENQTDRHRMETLGRMTMGIAHDFNNLLSGILGHIALMRENHGTVEDNLGTIEQAANGGAALVKKIQRYIRQEQQDTHEVLDLANLIQDCIVLTRPYWYNEPRRQGISIDLEYEPSPLPPILGSAAELRDVVVNLILNAVQAMPDGGVITIQTRRVKRSVEIRFTDTGTGMSAQVRDRIFEPLFTTKGQRGSGMGLSVAAGVIREHNGSVDVESTLGHGTTFTISFPAAGRVDSPGIPDNLPASSSSKRILVVDDEEMVRKVVDQLLTLRGHYVRSASSGAEAIECLQNEPFDLVISDQGMPEMSGRELAGRIKQLHPNVMITLLTGDTDLHFDPDVITAVITKPFHVDDLQEVIASLD